MALIGFLIAGWVVVAAVLTVSVCYASRSTPKPGDEFLRDGRGVERRAQSGQRRDATRDAYG